MALSSPPETAAVPEATILLVDDSDAFRDMTEMALTSLGYSVQPCRSGQEAITNATRSALLELLITDVVMAKMNGVQLAAEMLRICPSMKVLFCSGYPAATLSQQGLDLSRGEFLMKPISLATLATKVKSLLAR